MATLSIVTLTSNSFAGTVVMLLRVTTVLRKTPGQSLQQLLHKSANSSQACPASDATTITTIRAANTGQRGGQSHVGESGRWTCSADTVGDSAVGTAMRVQTCRERKNQGSRSFDLPMVRDSAEAHLCEWDCSHANSREQWHVTQAHEAGARPCGGAVTTLSVP